MPGTTKKPSFQARARGRDFVARADDAVEPGVARQGGEPLDLVVRIAARPRSRQDRRRRGWSARSPRRPWSRRARRPWRPPSSPARRRRGRSAPPGSMVAQRLDRLGDGVGDVVKLEVEEDRQARARPVRARPARPLWQKNSRPSLSPPAVALDRLGAARARGRGRACRWRRRSGFD